MKRLEKALLPTKFGEFDIVAFGADESEAMPHLALVANTFEPKQSTYVRIHSECMTGDVFGSQRCDCGDQLAYAMEYLSGKGGVLIYLRQEGRGIGLINKLRAYNLQSEGMDTLDANTHLGFEPDARDYEAAVRILKDLGISSVHLLTNNPAKIESLEKAGVKVEDRIPVIIDPIPENERYISTKLERMGHLGAP